MCAVQPQVAVVSPGEEASLSYYFSPDESFPPREFQVRPLRLAPPQDCCHAMLVYIVTWSAENFPPTCSLLTSSGYSSVASPLVSKLATGPGNISRARSVNRRLNHCVALPSFSSVDESLLDHIWPA